MPGSTTSSPTSLETAINAYLDDSSKSTGDGSYQSTAKSALTQWLTWAHKHEIRTLDDLTATEIRRYVQHLNGRMHDSEITASTVHTYFNILRGCLSWCVTDSRLSSNPADSHVAVEALPTDTQDPDTSQQFWTPSEIQQIIQHVDTQAQAAIEEDGAAALKPIRDRALVCTLTFSGARGAELFSSPTDSRPGRNGIKWKRVDLDAGTIGVLGKSQDWEHAQLPQQAIHALKQHYRAQQPVNDDWPVFPTAHAPSLYEAAREALAERGHESDAIEAFIKTASSAQALLDKHEIAPPALTTEGARSVMQRLCETADIAIDGEYLKPHGGRRGLGHILYQQQAELAQSALRHESIETTHDAYSDIIASETSDTVSHVLDNSLDVPSDSPE